MNDFSSHIIKSRHQGLHDLLARCAFSPEVESVAIDDACGRILAKDLIAHNTLPNTLTSAMDAIAVHFDDFAHGIPDTSSWERGREYEFCNTGIGIKGDFDTAIIIENVQFDDQGKITILQAPKCRADMTHPAGSSMKAGDVLADAGTTITPAVIGLAAQAGCLELDVLARPRVAFIPSGNELVPAGEELAPGKNIECNSHVIAAKLRQWGAEPVVFPICPDKRDALREALTQAVNTCDIVVLNAGSSKGTDDQSIETLEELGEVLNHEFDHGPGKHSSLSIVAGKPVIGISGPPIGAELCADWYIKPVVDAFLGKKPEPQHTMWATLTQDIPASPRPVAVVRRVKLTRTDAGELLATPLGNDIKPALRLCNMADAFLTIDKDCTGYHTGDRVVVELRYPYTLPA